MLTPLFELPFSQELVIFNSRLQALSAHLLTQEETKSTKIVETPLLLMPDVVRAVCLRDLVKANFESSVLSE